MQPQPNQNANPNASQNSGLKIGISACFMHPDPSRKVFAPKTLYYIEQSMAHWVQSGGALPVMIPAPTGKADSATYAQTLSAYAHWLDGLVLHGGADVAPSSYGEQALKPEWGGDAPRDAYEIALLKAFADAGKPVFGVCRGLQLMNVAYGGTLYQDINTQRERALTHRDAQRYDQLIHRVTPEPGSRLAQLLASQSQLSVNSVHHQAVKDLAPGFVVEARCPEDGTIEAIRLNPGTAAPWLAAVQWHPEFHPNAQSAVLDDSPLLQDFLAAAAAATKASTKQAVGVSA